LASMSKLLIVLCFILLIAPAWGMIEMSGGWSIQSNGQASSSGSSNIFSGSGDPTITLGVISSSSLDGPGDVTLSRTGAITKDIDLGGFGLSASFDGQVNSELHLQSEGTASASAFVGATAIATPTGQGSHEIYGTADVTTEGFLCGQGSATASATGVASYDITIQNDPTEVWGDVDGTSELSLVGSSPDSLASTGGQENGIHAESQVLLNRRNELSDSATSTLSTYASALNSASALVSVSGQAESGGWDPTSTNPKTKLGNENVASLASGTMDGNVIAPGLGDAADLSGVIESTATRNTAMYSGLQTGLYVSGGPSSYASAVMSSDADETYSRAIMENPLWGSVARQPGEIAQEWGSIDETGSGAIARESGAYALSFAKIQLTTDLLDSGSVTSSSGNMTLAVSTEVSGTKNAVAGAIAHGIGSGDMFTDDGYMYNAAGYIGDAGDPVNHYAYISSEDETGEIDNIAKNAFLTVEPAGTANLFKPFAIDTTSDPMYAWASTEGWYYQAH
jgi:hypothetical protein